MNAIKKTRTFLCALLLISAMMFPHNARAWSDIPNLGANIGDMVANVFGTGGIFAGLGKDIAAYVEKNITAITVTGAKMAALWIVQETTQAIIGKGNGGSISDWNHYLYIAPQQRAMAQMNSFFTTVSRGRLSSLSYEGIGPNYDAYLVAQARMSIAGQSFQTNLQDQVTDPSQLFGAGNMKGIMSYMQCANNVACYTLTSTARYDAEFAKAQEIAKREQSNGFLPRKLNGKIVTPAAIMSSMFTEMDKLGTATIMTAPTDNVSSGLMQIGEGMALSVAAKTMNYATSDSKGKDAIQNANDQVAFSLAYSSTGGIGVSADGTTLNSGVSATGLLNQVADGTCANVYSTPACCKINGGRWNIAKAECTN